MAVEKYGPHVPERTYIPHAYPEHTFDTGEIDLNHATAGSPDLPALVLIPGNALSWWSYESAMDLLKEHFQVFAVDPRGQGRTSRTPGRYTFENCGQDLVRFIAFHVRRPVIVSGCSSGGLIAAWLSAYAPPGLLRGAHYEDPALLALERKPERGADTRKQFHPAAFHHKYLGSQWTIGDEEGLARAMAELFRSPSPELQQAMAKMMPPDPRFFGPMQQHLKEYDPEWGGAIVSGAAYANLDLASMLAAVKCAVLFTHHFRWVDERTGAAAGAILDDEAKRVCELVTAAGQRVTYASLPDAPHVMNILQPERFARLLTDWAATLPSEAQTRRAGVLAT